MVKQRIKFYFSKVKNKLPLFFDYASFLGMQLYLVHCGFYDSEICDGLYESHVNFFVVAESFEKARQKAKEIPEFKTKRMHIDGLQEIQAVQGFQIDLKENLELNEQTKIINHKHRDLATKPPTQTI